MATKLKNVIVNASRNRFLEGGMIICAIIALIIAIIGNFYYKIYTLGKISFYIAIFLHICISVLYAVKRQTEDFIRKNKLIYIIFSDKDTVSILSFWIIAYPIICITYKVTLINIVILIISVILIIKLESLVVRHFRKKLSE